MLDPARIRRAYATVRADLLSERTAAGHWIGELSASALSTATALSALALVGREMGAETAQSHRGLIERGLAWLAAAQNADGGWGDTDKSLSNIATTMLVRAAFHLTGAAAAENARLARAEGFLLHSGGVAALRRRYGRDKTFAVPILTNCALAGLVPWSDVDALPFEFACLPYPLLRFLRLPVVSYAVPALVTIGQARYLHRPPLNPLLRWIRRWAMSGSLAAVARMQPHSGGFLEATPLTSFVVMSLAGTGRADHPVARRGVQFLLDSVRPDGSWPIDTNLATWNTTLAVNALAAGSEDRGEMDAVDWLLRCQHRQTHPFTNAAPGGWGWTDLSGAVPDADDTSGALLALAAYRKRLPQRAAELDAAAQLGVGWLLDLQNRDGGWPTFCRGWGALPFDRSGVDLTAHALRALDAWKGLAAAAQTARIEPAIRAGLAYLARRQRPDGSWLPLWFGNQAVADEENPIYGTARTLLAYRDLGLADMAPVRRGLAYLAAAQRPDGGWGPSRSAGTAEQSGMSSVEETAVALEAALMGGDDVAIQPVLQQGLGWLVQAVESGRHREPSPIGFYFARLWYYERLYPLVFAAGALGRALRSLPEN